MKKNPAGLSDAVSDADFWECFTWKLLPKDFKFKSIEEFCDFEWLNDFEENIDKYIDFSNFREYIVLFLIKYYLY